MNSHLFNTVYLIVNEVATRIPTPSSLSYSWNYGSILGSCLVVQILSGVFLTFHYSSTLEFAFSSVSHLEEVWLGWLVRFAHANGASLFFVFIYGHISRGLYFSTYSVGTWTVGVLLLLLLMGSAFLGYVLPWGQMSFWGATVITNLLSSLPYGDSLVQWVWGGFSVSGPTLSRFFSVHFLLPFVMVVMVLVHLSFLHSSGSSNPLGVENEADKVSFHPLFTWKDVVGLLLVFWVFMSVVLLCPDVFIDPDNFTPANPLSTPEHIQPEWYFLFAYAILRCIPNKLGGVIGLVSAVGVLFLAPLLSSEESCSCTLSPVNETLFWTFVFSFTLLTWLGSIPAEGIFIPTSQFVSVVYFFSLLLLVAV